MTLPFVSVVIPTYNRAAWLPGTVESVLQQTHPPAEVIIVDDGSTDGTEKLCAGFPAPVRYIRQENAGVSAARNRGIREAKNEWVALVDSDDIWRPHKLKVQLTVLVATPHARWCASGCEVIGTDGKPVAGRQGFERVFAAIGQAGEPAERFFGRWLQRSEVRVEEETHTTFTGDLFEMLFQGNVVLPSSVLIQRSLFEEVGLFDDDFRVAEETEFFHRVAAHANGTIMMSPLVGYRVAQSGSLTNPANTPRLIRNALTSLDRAAALPPQLTPAEQTAYQRGRRQLLSTLAYAELSLLNGEAAREAQQAAWSTGAGRTPRSLVIYAATLLPVPLLRGLHGVKRGFSAVRG